MSYGIWNLDSGKWVEDAAGRALHCANRVLAQLGAALAGELQGGRHVSRSLDAARDRQPQELTTIAQMRRELKLPTLRVLAPLPA